GGHRRAFRHVVRRRSDPAVENVQRGAGAAREHVDRGPAGPEVGEHLRGDLLRIGGHAFLGDTVVACGDDDRLLECVRDESPDRGDPAAEILEPAEAAPRLRLRVVRPPRVVGCAHASLSVFPATTKYASSDASTHAAFTRPRSSRYVRASALSGTMPRPTSFVTATVKPGRGARTVPSPPFATHSDRQSTITVSPGGTDAAAPCTSSGSSTVVHAAGRSRRCRSIRSAISSSPASPVAMNVTGRPSASARSTASVDLPLRAPPTKTTSVIAASAARTCRRRR